MQCRYCGRELKILNMRLMYNGSPSCKASLTGNHVSLPVPGCCIYCGRPLKPRSDGTLVYNGSSDCSASPTKKHCLM